VRFEVLTAVKMTMLFVWAVTPCRLEGRNSSVSEKHAVSILSPEEGVSMSLRNAGVYVLVYKASEPRRTTSFSLTFRQIYIYTMSENV
jgi:hypothetical protein